MKINCLKSPEDEKGQNIMHNECVDVYFTVGLGKAKEKRVRKVGGGVALNPPEETKVVNLTEKARLDKVAKAMNNPAFFDVNIREKVSGRAHVTGGVMQHIKGDSEDTLAVCASLAEKSREKIKLLRESIIQEIHNGIS